jgi:ribonuclease P protein component
MVSVPAWQLRPDASYYLAAVPTAAKSFPPEKTVAGLFPPEAAPSSAVPAVPGSGPCRDSAPLSLATLAKRADFLRAQKGIRRRESGLVLEACPTPSLSRRPGTVRVGYTASRKVGSAVARNRAKRRLRAAAAALLPLYGCAGSDYVLIAKAETLRRPFGDLLADLAGAIRAANRRLEPPPPGGREDRGPGQNRE